MNACTGTCIWRPFKLGKLREQTWRKKMQLKYHQWKGWSAKMINTNKYKYDQMLTHLAGMSHWDWICLWGYRQWLVDNCDFELFKSLLINTWQFRLWCLSLAATINPWPQNSHLNIPLLDDRDETSWTDDQAGPLIRQGWWKLDNK